MDLFNDNERLCRTMLDLSPDGIVLTDSSGNIVNSNETARRMFGYASDEFQRIRLTDISLDVQSKMEAYTGVLLKGDIADFESVYRAKDGRSNKVRIISKVLILSDRLFFYSLWRDIAENKKAGDKLNADLDCTTDRTNGGSTVDETPMGDEARARRIYGIKLIGQMASAVAHEVRNPLHALMSVTDALRLELKGNAELDLYVHHIHTQVERLSALMKDLLDLGKPIESANLHRESLAEICCAGVDHWKHTPLGQGRKVGLVLPGDPGGIYIIADSQRLQQVFVNLLDNAAQHSLKDEEISVVIEEPLGDVIRLKVADRGTGVPEKLLQKVFEPFFSTRKGGTGLGLNIVRNIVESHGGSLALSNNAPQTGCTAEITMPLAEAACR